MIIFYFYCHYFHTWYIIIPKITYSFRLIIIFFFFLFKKYCDISNYIIPIYFFILLFLFSVFFFFFSIKKSSNTIILSFNLSLIIFSFFHITHCLINQSNQFLIIGYYHFLIISSFLFLQTYQYHLWTQ